METITINKKKYVVVEQKAFEKLQAQAAAKAEPQKKLSLAAGKEYAHKLIDTWAKEK